MHVKTYSGKTTSAVLARIKADLGPDAVILDTREVEADGKTEVVMTAALERSEPGGRAAAGQASPLREKGASFAEGDPGMGWQSWQDEWAAIKGHLFSLMNPELQLGRLSPRQRVAVEFLEREGVDTAALLTIFEALLPDPQASILEPLARLVQVKPWGAEHWAQRVHLVAGPFGSGKTTTLVRMALLARAGGAPDAIWVVNADARRGGGRLLLKNYAHLCGLEYREAANALEFAMILREARSRQTEMVLVDLPGLPRGRSMRDLLEHFGMLDPDTALHLALTPQYGSREMQSLVTRYVPEGQRHVSLIWTKLDEAEKFGTLVTVGAASRIPVSALSCGPELSGTLAPADEAALWRLLFKREMPCGANPDGAGF